ncbi:MAG: mechanosensitive ion channel [Acidimicrobiaceae bacterium]|nr:mechanosensitive ion channel [Acidimicrobiaceae bacterium]
MTHRPPDLMHPVRWSDWFRTVFTLALAVALMGEAIHVHRSFHGAPHWLWTSVVWLFVVAFVAVGNFAVRLEALLIGKLVTARRGIASGAIVRLVATGLGFVVLLFGVFASFGLSVQRLLITAGVAGIIVGIAAQQSLANIFASLVLLFARPFHVGDDIVVRSGALGVVEGQVRGIGLTYVTLRTKEGTLKVPNSAMLASGIGRNAPPPAPPTDA